MFHFQYFKVNKKCAHIMQQGMDKLWGSEYKIVPTIIKNNSIVIILSTRKVISHTEWDYTKNSFQHKDGLL